jgi:hypothetical protein
VRIVGATKALFRSISLRVVVSCPFESSDIVGAPSANRLPVLMN